MRDARFWQGLLASAEDLRVTAPPFRFWGKTDPSGRVKPPIVAEVPDPDVDDAGTTATLRLYDPIDSYGGYWGVSAKEFAAALDSLPDGITDIRLHINSPGGEVYDAVAMLNALRRHPATVTAVVDGLAASAASVIATGSDRVVMARSTEMMIHDAWGIAIGPAEDMHFMGDRLDRLSNTIAAVYADKAGGTVEAFRALMLAETWYTADEAVEAGLADEVEQSGTAAAAAADGPQPDRSRFKHPDRAAAGAPNVPDEDSAAAAARALRDARYADRRAARHRQRATRHAG